MHDLVEVRRHLVDRGASVEPMTFPGISPAPMLHSGSMRKRDIGFLEPLRVVAHLVHEVGPAGLDVEDQDHLLLPRRVRYFWITSSETRDRNMPSSPGVVDDRRDQLERRQHRDAPASRSRDAMSPAAPRRSSGSRIRATPSRVPARSAVVGDDPVIRQDLRAAARELDRARRLAIRPCCACRAEKRGRAERDQRRRRRRRSGVPPGAAGAIWRRGHGVAQLVHHVRIARPGIITCGRAKSKRAQRERGVAAVDRHDAMGFALARLAERAWPPRPPRPPRRLGFLPSVDLAELGVLDRELLLGGPLARAGLAGVASSAPPPPLAARLALSAAIRSTTGAGSPTSSGMTGVWPSALASRNSSRARRVSLRYFVASKSRVRLSISWSAIASSSSFTSIRLDPVLDLPVLADADVLRVVERLDHHRPVHHAQEHQVLLRREDEPADRAPAPPAPSPA